MDAKDRDDSKLRQREEMLARRVGEALDQMDPHAGVDCPDAEVLAAYAERSLESADSVRWENHFAACARCRKILRVLAASDDTPLAEKEVAQLGELVSAARTSVETKERSPGPGRLRLLDWRAGWPAMAGWLAPALGVAAVLAVWLAVRPPWRATDHGASTTLIAQVPREETPTNSVPGDQFSKVAPEQTRKVEPAAPARELSANTLTNKRDTGLPASPPSLPSPKVKAAEGFSAPQTATGGALDAAKESLQAQAAAPVNAPAEDKKSPAAQRAAGGMAVPEVSSRFATNGRRSETSAALKTAPTTPIQATSPFGSTVWRAGRGGRIEYSADSGQSWSAQASPSQEDWLAGAAVSDTVCWLAGRNGAIARTLDGEHWERVTPPAQAAGTDGTIPDWTSITARDARTATVTARDRRHFTTSDGGATWQPQ